MRNQTPRLKRNLRFFRDAPKTLNTGQAGFPEGDARFQLRRLPERSLGSAPSRIGNWERRKLVVSAQSLLEIGGAQVFDEHAKAPAIGNRVMNRTDQHLVIGSTPKNIDPIERTLEQIEGLGKSLEREPFEFVRRGLGRNIAKLHHRSAAFPDQLDWSVFPREE